MTKLGKRDVALLILSVFIMLGSVIAITLGYDRVLLWFRLNEQTSRNKLAEVKHVDSSARRKEFLTPEFRPLRENQAVFGNDSVMTGHEHGLTINFLDGSKVELEPDTMVQILARDEGLETEKFHFDILVEKGIVKGSSPKKSVFVKRANTITVEVLKPDTTSLPVTQAKAVSFNSRPKAMEIVIDLDYLKKKQAVFVANPVVEQPLLTTQKKEPTVVAPSLNHPQNGSTIAFRPEESILFTWAYGNARAEFLLEVSADVKMSRVVYSTKTFLNFSRIVFPSTGEFYWRVTNLQSKQPSEMRRIVLTGARR